MALPFFYLIFLSGISGFHPC